MEFDTNLVIPPIFRRSLEAAENIARRLKSNVTTDILFFALLKETPRSFLLPLSNTLSECSLSLETVVEYARGFCKEGSVKDGSVRFTKGCEKVINVLIKMSKKLGAEFLALELLPLAFLAANPLPQIYSFILASEQEMGVKPEDSFIQILQESVSDFVEDDFDVIPVIEREEMGEAPEIQFCTNLNKEAEEGRISEIEDFDGKIAEMAEILCKRVKPNVLLIGEAGVGKTALAEGLALQIVRGKVPTLISDKLVYSVSLSSLVAGTQYRGQMEKRLEDLIKEVQSHNNIILFIDEVHTIVHAGSGSEDGLDVSNILKPALSRGNLSVIGATTLREYERTIKKDQALDRRFEKVVVRPPSSKVMDKLTEKILSQHEEFHGVKYSDEFKSNLVAMCDLHMPNRNYPDKAIDVVDKCGAAAKIERFNFSFDEEDIEKLNEKLREFADSSPPEVTLTHLRAYFDKKKNRLVASAKSGEFSEFKESLIFQKEAAAKIAAVLKGEHMGIYSHTGRPISFSLFGKTGNGKTHFLKNLAKFCSSNGINVIQINGAEYNFHNAGYALTEVRRGISLCEKVLSTPNSVIIIDDAEKLGESAANTLAQALKDGRLNAENGEIVDFTDSIFFFCAAAQNKKTMGFERGEEKGSSTISENLRKACVHSVEFSEVAAAELEEFVEGRMAALRKALSSSEIKIEGPKTAPKTLDEAVKLCEVTAPQKVQEALLDGLNTVTL